MLRYLVPVAVWGERFVDTYVNVSLPTMLSAGNLPALPRLSECEYILYTRGEDLEQIRGSNAFRRLASIMRVTVHKIPDENLVDPHKASTDCYRSAINHAIQMGYALLFVPPDEIVADGTIHCIDDVAHCGKRAVFLLTPRLLLAHARKALLEKFGAPRDGVLTLPARALVELALEHPHPVTESLYLDSTTYNTGPSHLYFRVGATGLLARGFHLHPIMVAPSTDKVDFHGTIDDDLVSKMRIQKEEIYVADNSDDMLMYELSDASRSTGIHGQNRADIKQIVNWVRNCTNDLHRSLVRHRILFHSKVEEAALRDAVALSDWVVEQVLNDTRLLRPVSDIFFDRRLFFRELPFIRGEVLREDFVARLEAVRPLTTADRSLLWASRRAIPVLDCLSALRRRLRISSRSSIGQSERQSAIAGAALKDAQADPERALAALNFVIGAEPTREHYARRAAIYAELGRIDESESDYAKAGIPQPAPKHLDIARRLIERGNDRQALEVLNRLIAQAPNVIEPYSVRAEVNERLGYFEQANADRLSSGRPNISDPWKAALALQAKGRIPATIEALSYVIANDPAASEAYRLRAELLEAEGRVVEAASDRATSGASPGADPLAVGTRLATDGRIIPALRVLRGILAREPENRAARELEARLRLSIPFIEMILSDRDLAGDVFLEPRDSSTGFAVFFEFDPVEAEVANRARNIRPKISSATRILGPTRRVPVWSVAWLRHLASTQLLRRTALQDATGLILVVGLRSDSLTSHIVQELVKARCTVQEGYLAPEQALGGGDNLPVAGPWPYPDALFDRVVLVSAFEHTSRPALLATEAVRCAKPGGLIVAHSRYFAPDEGQAMGIVRYSYLIVEHILGARMTVQSVAFCGGAATLLASELVAGVHRWSRGRDPRAFPFHLSRGAVRLVAAGINLVGYAIDRLRLLPSMPEAYVISARAPFSAAVDGDQVS